MNYLQLSAVLVSLHVKWVPTVRTIFELASTSISPLKEAKRVTCAL